MAVVFAYITLILLLHYLVKCQSYFGDSQKRIQNNTDTVFTFPRHGVSRYDTPTKRAGSKQISVFLPLSIYWPIVNPVCLDSPSVSCDLHLVGKYKQFDDDPANTIHFLTV